MKSSQRGLRWAALLLLAALPGATTYARARSAHYHTEAWARDRFAAAERMREALNGRPLADRTRHNYQRVINSYRNVYFGAPTSTKADPSVVAVAETLVEMGRRFDDGKILHEAIARFLGDNRSRCNRLGFGIPHDNFKCRNARMGQIEPIDQQVVGLLNQPLYSQ